MRHLSFKVICLEEESETLTAAEVTGSVHSSGVERQDGPFGASWNAANLYLAMEEWGPRSHIQPGCIHESRIKTTALAKWRIKQFIGVFMRVMLS